MGKKRDKYNDAGPSTQNVLTKSVKISKEHIDKITLFQMEDDAQTLAFPSTLSSAERKSIHQYAIRVGLKSKSIGKEPNRCLTVTKKAPRTQITKECESFPLQISATTVKYIDGLLQQDPLTAQECGEHLLEARQLTASSPASLPFNIHAGAKRKFAVPPLANKFGEFQEFRNNLPIYPHRQQILDAIDANQVLVISGETGSGKTTQVPQYILEEFAHRQAGCKIICTQPRRLAATSIADRVSQERNDQLGRTVGYQIRLDSCVGPNTNLIFTTSGYLLRCLMSGKSGELFNSVTHLILDEVHEREKITDFLLIAIRDALATQPNLKVILMSATLDSEIFCNYFNDCPVINVPGRLFSVDLVHLGEVLQMTGYRTKAMDNHLRINKGPKLLRDAPRDNWRAPSGNFGAPIENWRTTSGPFGQPNAESGTKLMLAIEKPKVTAIDAQFYDECLDECLACADESAFDQIFYMITDENMPVNYMHSEKSLSALMISTAKGFDALAKRLIALGAIGTNANDVTMAEYEQPEANGPCQADAMEAEYERAMQQCLSTAYQITSAGDEIDQQLLLTMIRFIHVNQPYDGSILVFLPGYDDIMAQKELIESHLTDADYQLFVLHSGVQGTNQSDQKRVFYRMPNGIRKIILSTNIAETSLTIEDVVYVVDMGKVKQTTYDSLSESTCLTSTWISQACAKQRAGRAGRTRAGVCYRMYSIEHYEVMEKFTLPELLRVPLTDICLNAKILGPNISIEAFLLKALQPPPVMSIRQSISLLKRIDALDNDENVTELGVHLADFPVDAQLAKCLLYAVIFRCIDPVVTIISALSVKDPFILSFNNERSEIDALKKRLASGTFSDHMILLNIYNEWEEQRRFHKERGYCFRQSISNSTMEMIHGVRSLIMRHLSDAGLMNDSQFNINEYADKWFVIKACLTAGLYPNVCHINSYGAKLVSKQDRKLLPHRSSILRKNNNNVDPDLKNTGLDWLIHGEKSKPSYVAVIRNVSPVSSMSIALFSGHINLPMSCIEVIQDTAQDSDEYTDDGDEDKGADYDDPAGPAVYFCLDDWVVFRTNQQYAKSVYSIRCKFNAILMKMLKFTRQFVPSDGDINVISTLVLILEIEEYGDSAFHATPRPIVAPSRNVLNSRQYWNAINLSPKRGPKARQNWRLGNRNGTVGNGNRHKRTPTAGQASLPTIPASASQTTAALISPDVLQQAVHEAEERMRVENRAANASGADYTLPSMDIVTNALKQIDEAVNAAANSRGRRAASNHADGQLAGAAASGTLSSAAANSLQTFRQKQSFTMITKAMAAETNQFKYFLLTIQSLDRLFATIHASNRWNFGMPLSALQKCKELNPKANIIIFFYVSNKRGIVGGGQCEFLNNTYQLYNLSKKGKKPSKCMQQVDVDFDHEMDALMGKRLYDFCREN